MNLVIDGDIIRKAVLIGPMSGIPHWNYPEFLKVEKEISEKYSVALWNPASNGRGLGYSKDSYLFDSLMQVTHPSTDAVICLPGFNYSEGARLEAEAARVCGKHVLHVLSNGRIYKYALEHHPQETIYTETPVPLKIGLMGKMRSGKDTLGERLSAYTGVPTGAIASSLKMGAAMMGVDIYNKPPFSRAALQEVGEWFTSRDPMWWVNLLTRSQNYKEEGLIITDVRNPGEVQWCKENDFVLAYLPVNREQQIERGADPESNFEHPTETRLEDMVNECDIILGQFESVEERVQQILNVTGSQERLDKLWQGRRNLAPPN